MNGFSAVFIFQIPFQERKNGFVLYTINVREKVG